MGHMTCALCQKERVLVGSGPICRKCIDAADTNTLEGALLVVFNDASHNHDDCSGWSDWVAKTLHPFVLGDKRHKHELHSCADGEGIYCMKCDKTWVYDYKNGGQPQPDGPCTPKE